MNRKIKDKLIIFIGMAALMLFLSCVILNRIDRMEKNILLKLK